MDNFENDNNISPVEPSSPSFIGSEPMAAPSKWAENEKCYIGTKVIRAMPMTETEFLINVKHKKADDVKNQETHGDGYKVTYEDGYISWSPRHVFEQCYREVSIKEHGLITSW